MRFGGYGQFVGQCDWMSSPLKSALLGLPLLATAALLTGCGSSTPASTPSTAAPTTVANASASGSPGPSATTPTSAASGTGSSGTKISLSCPSAAVVSAAIGETVPAPVSNNSGQGNVSCNYNDPNTSANVVLGLATTPELSDAVLKSTADGQASAQGAQAQPVSGYGDAAYIFTLNDASSNAGGVATSILLIKAGNTLIDITAQNTPSQVEALARVILAS